MIQGTKEWAEVNFNFQKGCHNDCVYCYAKATAIRFDTSTSEGWKNPCIVKPKHWPKNKTVMFPSSHDISSSNVETAIECLFKLLERDNNILVVTKAKYSAVNAMISALRAQRFSAYKERVSFRVTIGTADEKTLRRFEPNAPDFHERFMALRNLYIAGIRTSVSAEPLLGGIDTFNDLYLRVKRYLTDGIWVGKMNSARYRIRINTDRKFDEKLIDWIQEKQSDEKMLALYLKYRDDPRVHFKDSIIDVVLGRGKI